MARGRDCGELEVGCLVGTELFDSPALNGWTCHVLALALGRDDETIAHLEGDFPGERSIRILILFPGWCTDLRRWFPP